MSKKNSSVILKDSFKNYNDLSEVYLNFKKKIKKLRSKSFVIAVSGGADSLALAALAKTLSYESKFEFFYVLIDHNIRKNSHKEALKVKEILKKKNINLKIVKNKNKIKVNIQANARIARYDLLKRFCLQKNIKGILTAHNLEDQVETFFIRLSRGSGLTGLSSMQSISFIDKNIKLYRPLLNVKKSVLKKVSRQIFGEFINDPSNFDEKDLRTKIRNLKNPLKKSGIEYEKIIQSINNLSSSKAILDDYYLGISKELIKKKSNEININLRKFNFYGNEIKIRLINDSIKKLKKNYYNLRVKKILNLLQNLNYKKFKSATLGGCIFTKKEDFLCLKSEKKY